MPTLSSSAVDTSLTPDFDLDLDLNQKSNSMKVLLLDCEDNQCPHTSELARIKTALLDLADYYAFHNLHSTASNIRLSLSCGLLPNEPGHPAYEQSKLLEQTRRVYYPDSTTITEDSPGYSSDDTTVELRLLNNMGKPIKLPYQASPGEVIYIEKWRKK